MATQYIKRRSSTFPAISGTPHASPIYVDSDDNIVKIIPASSGTTEVQVVDVSSAQTLTNKTLTSPTINTTTIDDPSFTGVLTFTGTAATESDNVNANLTVTAASTATRRLVKSAITINTTGNTFSVTGGGSLVPIRGEITLASGDSFTDGFLYGVQGKTTLSGTMAEVSAARITGVLGQVDLSTGTLTAGQVSAVWGDLQGDPTLTVNDQLYVGRFTNSMSAGKKAQAFQLFYGAADFFLEASADGGTADWVVVAAVGGSQSHKLKVNIMGTTYYIPLNTA